MRCLLVKDFAINHGYAQSSGGDVAEVRYDPSGPLDYSSYGLTGTPYISNTQMSSYMQWDQPDVKELVSKGGLTIEFWCRVTDTTSTSGNGGPAAMFLGDGNYWHYAVTPYSGNKVNFWVADSLVGSVRLDNREWHHYAVTVTSSWTVTIFVDGVRSYRGTGRSVSDIPFVLFSKREGRCGMDYAQVALWKGVKWYGDFTPSATPIVAEL